MAGRITLVKLILLAIPNYFMCTARLPLSVCGITEKLARDFIRGSSRKLRKCSLMNWVDCCRPLKIEGFLTKIKFSYLNCALILLLNLMHCGF